MTHGSRTAIHRLRRWTRRSPTTGRATAPSARRRSPARTSASIPPGSWRVSRSLRCSVPRASGPHRPSSSAHDHGMGPTAAAASLALVGVFDVAGTVLSGWLTDRVDPRLLLAASYAFRGLSLLALPALLGPERPAEPRRVRGHVRPRLGGHGAPDHRPVSGPGRVTRHHRLRLGVASHQLGAAAAALGAGVIRDLTGAYTIVAGCRRAVRCRRDPVHQRATPAGVRRGLRRPDVRASRCPGVRQPGQSMASSSSALAIPRIALRSTGSKSSVARAYHSTLRGPGSTMRDSSTPERK